MLPFTRNEELRVTSDEQRAELTQLLHDLRNASQAFYLRAVTLQVHPFIEFTGLMNEYINLCEWALKSNIDYRHISIHSEAIELPTQEFQAAYIGEKFACIFSQWLQTKKLRKIFMKQLHPLE